MAKKDPIRVGLIGCGYQGTWLAKAIAEVDDLRLTGCVDPDAKAAAAVSAAADGATIHESPEAMLAAGQVDAVMVATPHDLLKPCALMAVEAGKHVLAEKPVGLNAREGHDLAAAVAERGVTFMAGYSFRYFELPARARQLLAEGALGEVKTISAGMALPGLRPGWPSNAAAGGGLLGFFGCHTVDRILWFLEAAPVEVFADVRYDPESDVDLTSVLQMRFAGGATAQASLCGGVQGPFDFIHVCGTAGYVYLCADAFTQYALTVVRKGHPVETFASDLPRETAILKKMAAELTDFAAAVRAGVQPPITIEDGCRVLEVLDAVILSGKTGQPVTLARKLEPDVQAAPLRRSVEA